MRKMWKNKLEGRASRKSAMAILESALQPGELILGVDPSLRGTGLALVEFKGGGKCVSEV